MEASPLKVSESFTHPSDGDLLAGLSGEHSPHLFSIMRGKSNKSSREQYQQKLYVHRYSS